MAPPSTTDSLVDAAIALTASFPRSAEDAGATDKRAAFSAAYRRWLIDHASLAGSPDERMEKIRLVQTAALAAPTLEQAVAILIRFGQLIMPELAPATLEIRGDTATIGFTRERRAGPAALISDLWPLALLLAQLECLAGRPLSDVRGVVRCGATVPLEAVAMLFDQPIQFDAPQLALVLPRRQLDAPIVAQYADVSDFLPRLMSDALGNAGQRHGEFAALLKGLLRLERLDARAMSTLDAMAARLGCSGATLRRRLAAEGSSFRALRDAVNYDLAQRWLADARMTIPAVAERLGFSDAYSFARFFTRLSGHTPASYRRLNRSTHDPSAI